MSGIAAGTRIAITVGSRGIARQPEIVRCLVGELRRAGAEPFVIPAMGSHGGATAQGQLEMLAGMGITEEVIGAPVRSSMDVVRIGTSGTGLPVFVDRHAEEADAIVVLNRVKPHVAFRGDYESGLVKMMAIGLGKQQGAQTCHDSGFGSMADNILAAARVVLEEMNVLFGVALLENAYHETCRIDVVPSADILNREPELLRTAWELMPRLHFDALDVLVIDEIGKDISGTGFDTNVVGRYHTPYASGGPDITRIAVLDLTDPSHGNASGIGIVDVTTRRLLDKMQFDQTYPNSLTSTVTQSVKIPMVLDTDRLAIQAAIRTCNIARKEEARVARITNTLCVEEIQVSANVAAGLAGDARFDVIGEPCDLSFDGSGNLF